MPKRPAPRTAPARIRSGPAPGKPGQKQGRNPGAKARHTHLCGDYVGIRRRPVPDYSCGRLGANGHRGVKGGSRRPRTIYKRPPVLCIKGRGHGKPGRVFFWRSGAPARGGIPTAKRKNPRRENGSARDRVRARIRARGEPCAICGRPIDYSLGMITDPRTGKRRPHPMSFVVDEAIPVSQGGDPYDAAPGGNCRPAHWICNQRRGDGHKSHGPTHLALPQPWDI